MGRLVDIGDLVFNAQAGTSVRIAGSEVMGPLAAPVPFVWTNGGS